jgi:Ser/Thr protein kinase RdoA (MazF antagonist)
VPAPDRPPAQPPDAGAIADAYGLGRAIGTPLYSARGELGRIWRLETSRGIWAVKELFHPADEPGARADVAFQEAVVQAGVLMPRPIVARDGRVAARVGPTEQQVTVRVYTWIDLAGNGERTPAEAAASILGRIHALAYPDHRPIDPWFTAAVHADRWVDLLVRADHAGAPWAQTLANLVPRIAAGDPIVAPGRHTPTIRCHLDFNPENVLVDTAGRTVVVDWEASGPEAAEQELASAIGEFVPDPAGTPAFLRAYAAAGGPATLREPSSFAMTFAFGGNLVASYAKQALDPATTEENRARAVHWIGDIAASAFIPGRIDAWLAAAIGD